MRTIVVTGSASGIGAATRARLLAQGDRVVGVDIRDADVQADLSNASGRRDAIARVGDLCGGRLDGIVTCAGLMGLPSRPGRVLAELNYFGTIEFLAAARPWLAAGERPAAVAISSNSTTATPGLPVELTRLLLDGDPSEAIAYADKVGSPAAYPATKLAVAHWVRRQATKPGWAGSGITLNAVAPGKTETGMLAEGRADKTYGPLIDAFPVPVGRSARPEELAALIGFLLSADARFICGSVYFCDGGTDAELRPNDFPAPFPARPSKPA
ncbi:SDR family oxidoreductase [Myxococcota bacterium]|nr:SDR family oxidoreductase [Myxococcota bacterium]